MSLTSKASRLSAQYLVIQPLRPLEEIRSDIIALEQETEGLLAQIVGGSQQ